jgi:hypothetical protein
MSECLSIPNSKIRYFPVRAVKDQLPPSEQRSVEASALAALKAAGVGPEIFYMKFEHDGMSFALHSRMNPKGGTLDIEYDFISPGMYPGPITQAQHRAAVDKFRDRRSSARLGGRLGGARVDTDIG